MKQNIKKGRYLFYEGEVYDLGGGGDSGEAMAKAEEALDAAQTAQTTADGAATAAGNAQDTADAALAKGLPAGGSSGQVLAKASATDYDAEWTNPPDPSGYVSYAEEQTLTAAQQAQARDNIGANWTLLWENASPTSAFSPQDISVALSGYDIIKILVKSSATGIAALYYDIPNVLNSYVIASIYANNAGTGYVILYNRRFTIKATGFHIEDAYGKALNTNTAPSIANTTCLPWRIYGGNLL